MALEANFTPPEKAVTEAETAKRSELIKWFSEAIDDAVVGLIVSGSMGYGYNYSVKETSDVDIQLIVTSKTVGKLKRAGFYEASELDKAVSGYESGIFGQFSLVFQKNGVNMECHFWDLSAFVAAITYQASETKRLRSDIETPSTDHGFSFSRDASVKDYFGKMVGEYAVGVFPSYREENGILYLCRPITNVLGLPRIERSNPELDEAMNQTWNETIKRLTLLAENGIVDLARYNIENTLPGKNKMRKDILDAIRQKTREKLEANNITIAN